MRLICPNCDAQYEIGEDLIPPSGREVQCSNCDYAWFQSYADPDEEAEGESVPQRTLDDAVAGILREEASREAEARRREGGSENLDWLRRGESGASRRPRDAPASSHLRPDAEEINAGLRAERPDSALQGRRSPAEVDAGAEPERSRALPILAAVALVVALGAVLYAAAPRLGAEVPRTEPALTWYMNAVDTLGLWLTTAVDRSIDAADAVIAYVTGAPVGGNDPG